MCGLVIARSYTWQVYGVVLPTSFEVVQRHLDLFNLNIFALPGLHVQCFGLPTFTSMLLARALSPLAFILVGGVWCWWNNTREKLLPFVLWLTFLVFSLVSSPAFQVGGRREDVRKRVHARRMYAGVGGKSSGSALSPTVQAFDCEMFNDGRHKISRLRADFSLVCSVDGHEKQEYTRLKILATLVVIMYPIGVPVLYAVLLFSSRRTRLAGVLSFLTSHYRASFFYWELVETAKKLLLASFFALPLMGHGTLMQLLVALVLQLVFLIIAVSKWAVIHYPMYT